MSVFTNDSREMILLGTGTSHGVPLIGCQCAVCSSSDPRNNRTRTGVAVKTGEGTFLIDTSPELRIQLLRERISVAHAVVYTHSHADHLFGLDDLRLFGYRLKRAIPLYCEEIVENQIRAAYSYAFTPPAPDLHYGALPQLELRRIGLEPFELLGIQVQPIRLIHGKLPVLGFRIGNIAFCTDVSFIPDESWPLLQGLDVLIVDALRIALPGLTALLCANFAFGFVSRAAPALNVVSVGLPLALLFGILVLQFALAGVQGGFVTAFGVALQSVGGLR